MSDGKFGFLIFIIFCAILLLHKGRLVVFIPDNRSNQMNPNHDKSGPVAKKKGDGTQADKDNTSDQKNPNSDKYQGKKK